jgi:uncharacterized protein (TIGR02246 family)
MKFSGGCFLSAAFYLLFGLLPATQGETTEKEHPAHDELRALMKEILAAYNQGDLDKLISYMDDDVVVTWQNGKVNKGPKAVKAYYEEMTKGPNRVVEKSSINPVPDELSILSNDGKAAFAWGTSKDHYKLTDGTEFDQDTRWSATAVKKDGNWKVASVHISANIFDNSILSLAIKKTAIWVGALAGGGGLLLGLLLGVVFFRRRS